MLYLTFSMEGDLSVKGCFRTKQFQELYPKDKPPKNDTPSRDFFFAAEVMEANRQLL